MTSQDSTGTRGIQVIAAALLASPLIQAVLGFGLVRTGAAAPMVANNEQLGVALAAAFLLAAVGAVAASFVLRRVLAAPAARGVSLARHSRALIVAMTLSDVPATLGLAYALITGDTVLLLILCGISLATGFLHFPTRGWLERIAAETRG